MSNTAESLGSSVGQRPDASEVRAHLERVLRSKPFRGSRRGRDFLAYVVTAALDGRAEELKERTLAIEVFGRRVDADLADDSIVRVGAREVRKRLAQYYVSDAAASERVRIEIPPGHYVPSFQIRAAAPRPLNKDATRNRRSVRRAVAAAIAAGAAAAFAFVVPHSPPPSAAAFERFWSPLLAGSRTVLLAAAHPLVYLPPKGAERVSESRLPDLDFYQQRPLRLLPGEFDGARWPAQVDQFVGVGDMVAAVDLARFLTARSREFKLRLASRVSAADLRDAPSILLGAFSNRWTMELSGELRYRFEFDAAGTPVIVDSRDRSSSWTARRLGGREEFDEDFTVLTRLVSPRTGAPMIIAAGVKQFGTEAAGRLLTSPDGLDRLLADPMLPDWTDRNLQVVLRTRILRGEPVEPELTAWHVWGP